jgi:nitric oxide reductase NorE protein
VEIAETHKRRPLPGVDGVWVLVGVDCLVFALLFGCFMQARWADPAGFEAGRRALDRNLGGINTLVLLTSSWAMALAIQRLRRGDTAEARRWLLLAGGAGTAFVVVKSIEYAEKLAQGTTPVTDGFHMWYFVLTGIHLVHVLVGLGLLAHLVVGVGQGAYDAGRIVVPECIATFWHLVDLLWIVIFPLLYLVRAG